jgi:signal peptidase
MVKKKAALFYARDSAQAIGLFFLTYYVSAVLWSLLPFTIGMRSDVVMSGSMAPKIDVGDVVVSAPISNRQLRPGMIISFTDPNLPERNLIHRMISRNPDGTVVTRGDANTDVDSTPVSPELINGQARVRIPLIGLPAYWFREKQYVPLGTALGALIFTVIVSTGSTTDREVKRTQPVPAGGDPPDDDPPAEPVGNDETGVPAISRGTPMEPAAAETAEIPLAAKSCAKLILMPAPPRAELNAAPIALETIAFAFATFALWHRRKQDRS